MRVALNLHHVGDAYRAIIRHAADIVAAQVDQHDMLSTFLGIREQLLGKRPVFRLISSPAPRTGQGANGHLAVLDPHQDLG